MTKKECMERLSEIVNNSATRYTFETVAKDWEAYGKSRTYFKIVEKSDNYKASKHYATRDYGYLDNLTGEYVAGKSDLTKNYTFGGASF